MPDISLPTLGKNKLYGPIDSITLNNAQYKFVEIKIEQYCTPFPYNFIS